LGNKNIDICISINNSITFGRKDIIKEEKELKEDSKEIKFEDILNNIQIIQKNSDEFLQRILNTNPHLLNKENKKENEEEGEGVD
ncbi:MAG: hypothetical protein MJ252_16935, partial [archaeon]|nr:hypothetical protein [archaeon]